MTNEHKAKLKTTLTDYVVIAFGMGLYVLSWTIFLIPAEITGGGISGLSAVIFYSTHIPVAVSYFVINVFLILIAIKVLGASFGIKTIFSMLVATLLFWLTPGLIKEPLIDDTFLSAALGGMMGGVGIGIVFTRGGSTGGTDIIAMIINKYRNISPGRVIMYCDVIIIASSYFVFQSPGKLVYGYVSMWVVSYTIDAFLNGSNASAQIFIFSRNFEEIADYINKNVSRGVTVLDGTGWYTKENVKVVMTVVRKRESSLIFRKLKEIDPEAFISMGSVMGVYGQGFDKMRI
ncbi:YitT family protein [uncultured Sunxiuqinia sp.]|uniref:YitT family protein n=1 Tax=uncultured Sunxiuqinia sp. TaxID=1573825 RepID=UPI0019A86F50|nr:YitT family protein [Sunxiuqinia sp.]|tara:strand:+ start:13007 stop:13876 length:870 start_codon:yes stop_codon:yes gene_type:complete